MMSRLLTIVTPCSSWLGQMCVAVEVVYWSGGNMNRCRAARSRFSWRCGVNPVGGLSYHLLLILHVILHVVDPPAYMD